MRGGEEWWGRGCCGERFRVWNGRGVRVGPECENGGCLRVGVGDRFQLEVMDMCTEVGIVVCS